MKAQTETNAFPFPRIEKVRPILSGAKYLASLDLLMYYHHVEVDSCNYTMTAFLTNRKFYIYNVMPLGLCNVPANFQRLKKRMLCPMIGVEVLV